MTLRLRLLYKGLEESCFENSADTEFRHSEVGGSRTEKEKVKEKMKGIFFYPPVDPGPGLIAVACSDRSPPQGPRLKVWLLGSVCERNQSKLSESTGEINKVWPKDFFFPLNVIIRVIAEFHNQMWLCMDKPWCVSQVLMRNSIW